MNSLLDNDDEFARGDRELTLSTGAILGIFLGLVLLCGLFFGFGYKMGSRKPGPPVDAESSRNATPPATAPTTDFNAFKPAAGSPEAGSASNKSVPVPATRPHSGPADESSGAPIAAPAPGLPSTPAERGPASAPNGNFVVQVAAVTLQEDASLLVGALRSKGYTATEHAQPDKLIHIQVGPFATRKDADAMRQRLLSDGYNAIVK
jgi:cell division septation protein DedD